MKYLALFTFGFMLLLSGCGDSDEEILQKAEEIKTIRKSKNTDLITVKKEDVISFHKDNFSEKDILSMPKERIRIIELYGCEYILYEKEIGTRWGVAGLAHKGNCVYCAYNKKDN